MPGCQSNSSKEVTAATCGRRLTPDEPASGNKASLQDLLDLLILAQEASMPEGRLQDGVQRGFDSLVGNVIFTDQAEDSRVKGCDMPLPVGKRTYPILGLFVCDLREGPGRGVVGYIVYELIKITANARVHSR